MTAILAVGSSVLLGITATSIMAVVLLVLLVSWWIYSQRSAQRLMMGMALSLIVAVTLDALRIYQDWTRNAAKTESQQIQRQQAQPQIPSSSKTKSYVAPESAASAQQTQADNSHDAEHTHQ